MLDTSLGMRMKNIKSKAFCTLKHCLCVRLGCMAILKKKFISEFIRFLVCRTGVVLFSSFLWRAKASAPRASGGGIGMRVGGIFLSIQPRACLALSARLALSSAQQKKKGIEF